MKNIRFFSMVIVLLVFLGNPGLSFSMVTGRLEVSGNPIVPSAKSSYSPDSSKVLVRNARVPNELLVYNTTTGALLFRLSNTRIFSIWRAEWSPDGKTILSYNSDETITIWRLSS